MRREHEEEKKVQKDSQMEERITFQKQHFLKGCFYAWQKQCMYGRMQSIKQDAKIQIAALKSKTSLSLQRAMSGLTDKGNEAAKKAVFEAWMKVRMEGWQEKYTKLLFETKNKGKAQMKRILAHMSSANEMSFARTVFQEWYNYKCKQNEIRRENNWKESVNDMERHKKNQAITEGPVN